MARIALIACAACTVFAALAETVTINGVEYECRDGICAPVRKGLSSPMEAFSEPPATAPDEVGDKEGKSLMLSRLREGYMSASQFVRFLEGADRSPADFGADTGWWAVLVLILLGGVALNLTPCVLPMIPVSLMIIGRSVTKGIAYGLGIVAAFGTLGVLAAIGGLAFGEIQSNPWFNLMVALVFIGLGLSLAGLFPIDLARYRRKVRGGAFVLGIMSAVLSGACVAPILIAVLVLTARLYAEGRVLAVGLPFLLGLGMALPWPLLGAGLSVLPRPGGWMNWINRLFAIFTFGLAVWYGMVACQGFMVRRGEFSPSQEGQSLMSVTPDELPNRIAQLPRPILVDCGASWCKNCTAMERFVLSDPQVKAALERGGFTVIKVAAEDLARLRSVAGFGSVYGLPAFAIFE